MGAGAGRLRGWLRRRWAILVTGLLALVLVGLPLTALINGEGKSAEMPLMRVNPQPAQTRSVSIDFGIVTNPDTDWQAINRNLAQGGANAVALGAGRVEFTAFDWPAFPKAAAVPGTDHLAAAAAGLNIAPDGSHRSISLIVDAYMPEWIGEDPELACIEASGKPSRYRASLAELDHGQVGDRLVAYVAALGERYNPAAVEVTELFLDSCSFGADDLALFRTMTGNTDWPRTKSGAIDGNAAVLGPWRSQVLSRLLVRMRAALDQTRGGAGREIGLVADVRVNWDDPAAGRPLSGQDYPTLLSSGATLQLWAYPGRADVAGKQVERLTAGLQAAGYDMSRFIVSVGLWQGPADTQPPGRISPQEMVDALRAAGTHGITAVNLTPYSLMTPEHWQALQTMR